MSVSLLCLMIWSCKRYTFLGLASDIHFVLRKQRKFWCSLGSLQIPPGFTRGVSGPAQRYPADCKYLLDRVCG